MAIEFRVGFEGEDSNRSRRRERDQPDSPQEDRADAPFRGKTKKELLDEAGELGVPVKPYMTKAQIQTAIQSHQAGSRPTSSKITLGKGEGTGSVKNAQIYKDGVIIGRVNYGMSERDGKPVGEIFDVVLNDHARGNKVMPELYPQIEEELAKLGASEVVLNTVDDAVGTKVWEPLGFKHTSGDKVKSWQKDIKTISDADEPIVDVTDEPSADSDPDSYEGEDEDGDISFDIEQLEAELQMLERGEDPDAPADDEPGPLFEATAGESGGGDQPPPPKPPTDLFDDDDSDDEDVRSFDEFPRPNVDKPFIHQTPKERKRLHDKAKAATARRLRKELTQKKRVATKARAAAAKRERLRRNLVRDQINERAKQQKEQIKELHDRGSSDRLIRRLATFGLAEAAGVDGGLLTAAAELLIFQPEIAQADEERDRSLAEAEQRRQEELRDLDTAKTETTIGRDQQELDIADLIDESRLELADTGSVDLDAVQAQIDDVLGRDVEVPTGAAKSAGSSRSGGPGRPNTPGSSSVPPGASFGPSGTSTPPGGSPGGTGGGGPRGPGGGLVATGGGGAGGFPKALAGTTAQLLAATVALRGLKVASDAAAASQRKVGEVLTSPDDVVPAAEAMGAVAETGGMIAGGAIGATFGPIGAVAGAIVGKAISSAIIEPIVGFIDMGQTVLRSMATESLGSDTIVAKSQANIDRLINRIDNSYRGDESTAKFVQTSSEFSMAINDLKTTIGNLIEVPLNFIVKHMTYLIRLADMAMMLVEISNVLKPIMIILEGYGTFFGYLAQAAEILTSRARGNQASTFTDTINQFFGGNQQASLQGSLPHNFNRNIPESARLGGLGFADNLSNFGP